MSEIINKEVAIGYRKIGINSKPFIIAEMSGNHNQSIDKALEIVDAAAEAGADAIKLQTYTPDTMTLDCNTGSFVINDKKSLWSGKNLHQLYKQAYTPWEWHKEIFKRASEKGIICFSSPFDTTAVDFLETLNVPAYKIASFENNHIPLIKKVASTKKPIIISTGMASIGDIEKAVNAATQEGCKNIILLKCTSTYPANPTNSNIKTIPHLRSLFNCEVGLSDHTLGIGVAIGSIALGATVIEKHFTLSRDEGGVDSAFSLEPKEFKLLTEESKKAWQALGKVSYGYTEAEKNSLIFRRSIYISEDIKIGETFNQNNIKIIRPGDGAPPNLFDMILGKKAKKNFKKGTPLKIDDLF